MKINSKHRTISRASLLIHRYDIFITSANRIPHKLRSLVSRGNSRAPFRKNFRARSSRVDYHLSSFSDRIARNYAKIPDPRSGQRLRIRVVTVAGIVADRPDARGMLRHRHRAINVDADSRRRRPRHSGIYARWMIISGRKVSSLLPEKRRIYIEILVNSVTPRRGDAHAGEGQESAPKYANDRISRELHY